MKLNKRLQDLAPYLILFIISIIVFCNALSNVFVYDDSVTIVNNNLIKSWSHFYDIFSFNYFILSGELSYRPVVTVAYFVDHYLWGLNPAGFHLTNISLQAANTLVFYFFLKRITPAVNTQNLVEKQSWLNISPDHPFKSKGYNAGFSHDFKKSSRVNTLAFISALLFTTHPIITETVNSISYREDLLSALFFLIAFILFLKIDKELLSRGKFILYYTGSLFSYMVSLFSKEMAVALPILLIVYNYLCSPPGNPLQTIIKKVKNVYLGYFFVTGFYLFIQFVLFKHAYIRLDQTKPNLLVMIKVLASYLKLLFLPLNLNADYVVPSITTGSTSFLISVFLVSIMIIVIIRLCRNNKQYCFFVAWFFVTLLPVSNIIPIGNTMAERYLYIPVMGFLGLIGALIHKYISEKKWLPICCAFVIVILSFLSVYRNGIWRDELTLWYSTSLREPGSARAHHNLGVVHSGKGFYDYAELEYKKTLEINPRDVEAHYNLGNAYERKGMTNNAIDEYQEAIRYNPYYADGFNNLGTLYKNKYLLDLAAEQYKKAIQINPFNPNYYNNLGSVYHEKKLYKEAIAEFKKALKMNTTVTASHNNLGNAYKEMGNFNEALNEYKAVIGLDANNVDAHNNLGIVYINTNKLSEAVEEFQTAIQLNPRFANAHNNLGIAYAKNGDFNMAIDELNSAVALGFDNADVHNNLAGVYLTKGLTDNAIVELKLALKFDPKDSNAHCNLGNAYISKNLGSEAISEFKEALTHNSADAEIYYYLGNAFYKTGRYGEASDALCQSVHYQSNNPLVHKMLGVIYSKFLNNPSKALFHLNETLRLDPQQSMAKEITEIIRTLKK